VSAEQKIVLAKDILSGVNCTKKSLIEVKMKKSLMVAKISQILTLNSISKKPKDFVEMAKEILALIEENGMKPPLSKSCPVLLTNKHVWEPETK
jgi:hypothetical protein